MLLLRMFLLHIDPKEEIVKTNWEKKKSYHFKFNLDLGHGYKRFSCPSWNVAGVHQNS